MSLDEFDVKKEIKKAFKRSISDDFKTLYNALIKKEGLPTDQVLHLIKILSDESQLKERKLLELKFLEKQQIHDRNESLKDNQEAQKDEQLKRNALREKQTLQHHLDTLQSALAEQRQLHQQLQQTLSTFTTGLIHFSAFKEAHEKPLEVSESKIVKKSRQAVAKAKALTKELHAQVKEKLASEEGLLFQIEQVKKAMIRLDKTTFKELEERQELRQIRQALRQGRKEANELVKPIAERLSSEIYFELQKESKQKEEKINDLKTKLEQEVKTKIHSWFLDFLEGQFTSFMSPPKKDLQIVFEIAKHIQTLERNIDENEKVLSKQQCDHSKIKDPLQEISTLTLKNHKLQNQIQATRFFKKSAILSASASTLGAVGAIAAVTLLLSTPPVAITASFLLLTAIATVSLVIRLHQYQIQKEKEKQDNQHQLGILHVNQSSRVTLEESIQNTIKDLRDKKSIMVQRLLTAGRIHEQYRGNNPSIYLPCLSSEARHEEMFLEERAIAETSSRTIPALLPSSPRSSISRRYLDWDDDLNPTGKFTLN